MKKFVYLFYLTVFLWISFLAFTVQIACASPKEIRVGVYDNKPLIYKDETGAAGLFIDVLEDIAEKENWKIIYHYGDWNDVYCRIQNNELDLLPVVAYKETRKEYIDYSNETLISNFGEVFTRKDIGLSSIQDLSGKTVATIPGDTHGLYFKNLLNTLNVKYENREFENYVDIFKALESGQCDAGVVNHLNANIDATCFNIRSTPIVFNPIKIHYAAQKGDPGKLLSTLDKHIAIFKENNDSIYHQSMVKFFQAELRPSKFPKWIPLVTVAAATLLALLAVGNLFLRVQVKKRTKEISAELEKRELAEARAFQSEEKYRTMVERSNDMIWMQNRRGSFTFMNHQMETSLGIKSEEWIGKSCKSLVVTDDWQMISDYFKRVLEGGSVQLQLRFKRHDNEILMGSVNTAPIIKKGEVTGLVSFCRDITEQRELERRLQQSQKMEAIGTLAGGIAHDFNNILSGIFGYAQMAQMNIEDPEKANANIGNVIKGAQRAAEITRQILTFSRQKESKKKPSKIYLEISEALKLLRSSIPSSIKIKTKLESRKEILADPAKIHQIVMNLCTNAYHAMRKTGGELSVSLADVKILQTRFFHDKKMVPGEYVNLKVSDTGYGMDEKTLVRAFDPYFTTKGMGYGTGLGLSLVQAIVDEHDGFIEVASAVNHGTTFQIYFPVVQANKNVKKVPAKKISHLNGNEKIMVVDDEEAIRDFYKNFLENSGYQVSLFKNGIEALDHFKDSFENVDLIITDATMPELTGDKLALEVLKIQPTMPIVLCTGYSDTITESDAIKMGIKKFVQKPIGNKELLHLVREVLDKK